MAVTYMATVLIALWYDEWSRILYSCHVYSKMDFKSNDASTSMIQFFFQWLWFFIQFYFLQFVRKSEYDNHVQ